MPKYLQHLRCKVNFQALAFVPHIRHLEDAIINRLRYPNEENMVSDNYLREVSDLKPKQGAGKYAVLHLRFDKIGFPLMPVKGNIALRIDELLDLLSLQDMAAHSACDFGGGKAENLALAKYRQSLPTASNVAESRGFLRKEGVVSSVTRRNMDVPSTPGRPIFSFSVGNFSRKNFPSKWDDAEKWLVNGSSIQDSPASHHNNGLKPSLESSKLLKQRNGFKFKEAENIVGEKINRRKDKFTDEVETIYPNFRCLEPTKEGFLFGTGAGKSMKEATMEAIHEVKHRDIGTEMTPIGSSTTSRCHTPFKSPSPATLNTPADRSGPLVLPSSGSDSTVDIMQFQECHLAKLQAPERRSKNSGPINLQNAKAEDQSKKLEGLDKISSLALTDKEVLGESDNTKLEIQIKLDKEKKFFPFVTEVLV
ncbi:hypothetical protein T459_30412 [Capsicum annuum]|uniref:O-fucosyltransferase family protein n=1 Tax=Capsicum annuum TaxID=4072 RepID=A0A2G2Y8A7_CAPAN|nr:hypothetical protein T459_30412 [Capsicum annuum]